MKTVITGATGFLGRNLAESLHADGLEVIATGRSLAVGDQLREEGIEFQAADILDPTRLEGIFSGADCVIHCAALAGDWGRYKDFYDANVVGTRNVIAACRRCDVKRIIHVSTPSIYYTGQDRYEIAESEPLPAKPATHYAKTKLIAEKELTALQEEGHQVINFRPRAVHGPYDSILVPRILRMAEKGRLPLINNGQAMTDITYVDNFIDAVRKSLAAPSSAWNEVYNLSNGDPISIRDWFSQVLAIFGRPFNPKNVPEPAAKIVAGLMELATWLPFGGKKPLMTRFSVGYMARSMTMKIDKARRKLNYVPKVGNQEGFEMYAKWYRSR